MEKAGQINVYTCGSCGGEIVTVNTADGATPAFLHCRARPVYDPCLGEMVSSGYLVPQDLIPTHAWVKATEAEMKRMDPNMRDHCRRGGLMLQKLDQLQQERYGKKWREG